MIDPVAFVKELKDLLDVRPGVQNVAGRVFRYPPGKQADNRHPTLYFDEISDVALEDASLLGDQQAVYQVTGGVSATSAGASDDDYARAHANAWAMIRELIGALEDDETVNGEAGHARVTSWSGQVTQGASGNLFYDIEFVVTAQYWP